MPLTLCGAGELAKAEDASRVNEAEFSQPLCTALQIGLVNLLRSWGVSPTSVVGHSSGEIAAAYTANAITATAAIIIAYYRGQATKNQKRPGGMLAVGMGKEAITPYLIEGVVVACVNSPNSVTLSGDEEPISKIAEAIKDKQPDVLIHRLKVGIAYHSCKHIHNSELGSKWMIACLQDNRSHARDWRQLPSTPRRPSSYQTDGYHVLLERSGHACS